MMLRLLRLLGPSALGLALVGGLLAGIYEIARPTVPAMTSAQLRVARSLGASVSDWLGQLRVSRGRAVLLTLDRDPFGVVSGPVRDAFFRSDLFDLADYSVWEKFRRLIRWTRPIVATREQAVSAGRRRQGAYVVWGRVESFTDRQGEARLVTRLEIVETTRGEVVGARDFDQCVSDIAGLVVGNGTGGYRWPFATRLLIWLAVTLCLPLVSLPLSRKILAGDSNAAILGLLVGHVAVSTGLAYLLFAWFGGGMIQGAVLFLACTSALFYTWHALVRVKEASL